MSGLRYSLCLLAISGCALVLLSRQGHTPISKGTARRALSTRDSGPPNNQSADPTTQTPAQPTQPFSLPLTFEANLGQANPQIAFQARGQRFLTLLTSSGID